MSQAPLSLKPLTEPTFYILLSLVPGKKHGYAILKDVQELSNARVSLSTSTLYSAISRLLDQKLIERLPDEPESKSSPGLPRKVYTLTRLGKQILEAETQRMQRLILVARWRLGQEGV